MLLTLLSYATSVGISARLAGQQLSLAAQGCMVSMAIQLIIYLVAIIVVVISMVCDWDDSTLGTIMALIGTFASELIMHVFLCYQTDSLIGSFRMVRETVPVSSYQ